MYQDIDFTWVTLLIEVLNLVNILKLSLEKSSLAMLLFYVWSSWIAQKNYMYQDIDFTWVTLFIALLNLVNILKLSLEKSSPAMLLFYVWSSWIAQQIRLSRYWFYMGDPPYWSLKLCKYFKTLFRKR